MNKVEIVLTIDGKMFAIASELNNTTTEEISNTIAVLREKMIVKAKELNGEDVIKTEYKESRND